MARKDKYGFRESLPRFYKSDYELQQKAGTGTLDAEKIAKLQTYLDNVQVDIVPQLLESLGALQVSADEAAQINYGREEFLPQITKSIMDIKSNSGMFHEMAVCRISSFMLTFLDDVRKCDQDILNIIAAYIKVIKMLLDLKIKQETDPVGQTCLAEIRNVTKRYYDKSAAAIKG
jgi:hypothetical protein